jgi:hypothetical protein
MAHADSMKAAKQLIVTKRFIGSLTFGLLRA